VRLQLMWIWVRSLMWHDHRPTDIPRLVLLFSFAFPPDIVYLCVHGSCAAESCSTSPFRRWKLSVRRCLFPQPCSLASLSLACFYILAFTSSSIRSSR